MKPEIDTESAFYEPEKIAGHHSLEDLPSVFRTRVETQVMQPLLRDQQVVAVQRRVIRRGEVACLRSGRRLYWRRASALTHRGPRWTADLSPLPAAFGGEVVGVLIQPAIVGLVRFIPNLWTNICWKAGMTKSLVWNARERVRTSSTRERSGSLYVRVLTEVDVEKWTAFETACGHQSGTLPWAGTWLGLWNSDDELVGRAGIEFHEGWAFHHSIFVAPGRRGRGAGNYLLSACIRYARSAGKHELHCTIHPRNLRSERLHAAHGFTCGEWTHCNLLSAAEYPTRTWRLVL